MDKVLVEVYVPVLNTSYDMFIPLQPQMYKTLELIKRAVTEMSDGRFVPNDSTAICYHKDGTILNINLSAYELKLRNSSKLMLV